MRPDDPQLILELTHDVAEVGGHLTGHVRRNPRDGVANPSSIGRVRAVRVGLHMTTEGRGDTDTEWVATVEVPVDDYGMTSQPFELAVPPDAPISYDGSLVRVRWRVEARTDRKLAIDSTLSTEVLIVPRGGADVYDRPHPLR